MSIIASGFRVQTLKPHGAWIAPGDLSEKAVIRNRKTGDRNMKALHSVTMALPLAATMLFAQSQTTQTPSARPDQSSSSQTDRSAQPGQTERSTQPGQTDRSGQADRPGQSSTQGGAQSGQPARTPSGAGQSPSTQSSASQADRAGASMTFTGTIVNADCSQAQALINRTSGSYADRDSTSSSSAAQSGAASSTSQSGAGQSGSATARNQKSVYDLQRDVMRRCAASAKTEDLALLTDDGRFLKTGRRGIHPGQDRSG
jgi:hypothetical protein